MAWLVTISYTTFESLRLRLVGHCQYDVVTCYIPQLYFIQPFNTINELNLVIFILNNVKMHS